MALICGDIHGNYRKAEAFLAYRPGEEHIFVGDYADSSRASEDDIVSTLRLIMQSEATALWGNHDLQYLPNATASMECSGRRDSAQLRGLYRGASRRFAGAAVRDGYLIVHGGLSALHGEPFDCVEQACDWINAELRYYIELPIVPAVQSPIFDIGRFRGGAQEVGGPFWLTFGWEEFDPRFCQVVGHTRGRDVRIEQHLCLGSLVRQVCVDTPLYHCFNTVTGFVEDFMPDEMRADPLARERLEVQY